MLEQGQKMVSQYSVDLSMRILGPLGANQAYYLEYLLLNFPHGRALKALEYLHSKGIRGKLFEEYVRDKCKSSALEFVKQTFRGMEHDSEVKPIFAKDLRA